LWSAKKKRSTINKKLGAGQKENNKTATVNQNSRKPLFVYPTQPYLDHVALGALKWFFETAARWVFID
jgi:hypothetical protein